jgi:hypothetical protein
MPRRSCAPRPYSRQAPPPDKEAESCPYGPVPPPLNSDARVSGVEAGMGEDLRGDLLVRPLELENGFPLLVENDEAGRGNIW